MKSDIRYIEDALKISYDQISKILAKKNADYSGPNSEFGNFVNSSCISKVPVEQGILVRMSDKFSRLGNLLQPNVVAQVTEESIDDTISDLIGYAVILKAYRRYVADMVSKAN